MLKEYEADHHTEMNISEAAGEIYQYTSGYPYLVSAICKILDETLPKKEKFSDDNSVWVKEGVINSEKHILKDNIPLFGSMIRHISEYPDMKKMLYAILFQGEQFVVEMKIWHGNEYNERGEKQLTEYLEYYHQKKGHMLSFNFNKKKETGMKVITLGDKTIVEAVV